MKIVQIEPLGLALDILNKTEYFFNSQGHDFVYYTNRVETKKEIIARAKDAEILIVSNIPIDKEILDACKNLKLLNVAFAGVDHIDLVACKDRNILVSNAGAYSTTAVSELTIALAIALFRNIIPLNKNTRDLMSHNNFLGLELSGKTVGILGTGRIGLASAKLFNAFSCKIIANSRSEKDIDYIEYVEIYDLFKNSDIICLHIPSNPETNNLIDSKLLSLMKKSAILINTARGQILDTNCLANMLNEGKIAGAAIDVYEMEPPLPANHPLLTAKNTILLPHIAYATKEAMINRYEIVKSNINAFLNAKPENLCF